MTLPLPANTEVKGDPKLKKYDVLWCLFLEVNGNLIQVGSLNREGNTCFDGKQHLIFFL